MSKTKEELDALKEEINKVNEKICELTPEELEQVNGGHVGLLTSPKASLTCTSRGLKDPKGATFT